MDQTVDDRARPWRWFVLFLPFGATSGYVAVTLGYVANQAGMSDGVVASLVGLSLLPHTWKFFWAPVVDTTFTRKRWYIAANLFSSLTIALMGFIPLREDTLWLMRSLVFVNSLSMTFLGMAVEGLMAHATRPEHRGRASGWFQAGNLGGAGIGGGLALWLWQHVSGGLASIVVGALLFSCVFTLPTVPETPREKVVGVRGGWAQAMLEVARDLWATFASRSGVIALVLCFLPLGAGAASGLFSALGDRWGASEDLVSAVTGIGGGFVAAFGCLVGGWMSDRLNRKVAYALAGICLATAALALALLPHTPFMFALLTLNYSFDAGLVYGTFTGFVLEVIGKGAAATKYNALASLSNIPIMYMTFVLGYVSDNHGVTNMLLTDAGAGLVGLAILLPVAYALRARPVVAPAA